VVKDIQLYIRQEKEEEMYKKSITLEKRKSVYAEGKQAFGEHTHRSYNPYARSNLTLSVQWWHGWDTAEEENSDERALVDEHNLTTQPQHDVWL
jgi:hypothetical protein